MPAIVENVVYQHAENVCSLWVQRQNAVEEPHYSFTDLVYLDNRVEANLEGLRVSGVPGIQFIDEMIKAEDEGAYFAKALLSLEKGQREVFDDLVTQAENNGQIQSEIESALAWVKPEYLKSIVKELLTNDKSAAIILGLKTCASHKKDPGHYSRVLLNHSDSAVRSAALAVCANLGLRNHTGSILNMAEGETEEEKYEQGRALAFLNEQCAGREILYPLAVNASLYSTLAVNILMQLHDVKYSESLLKKLDAAEGRERDVVRGFGLIGDPVAMDWLIDRTEIPALSRLSGGSITMITGVDLAYQDLQTLDDPDGYEYGGANDNPEDDNVALDEDEDLPWPNPKLVRSWWESSVKLPVGKLFLDGREKVHSELQQVLVGGMQRQRNAAANSLAILLPEMNYLDTRLPTSKQKLWMSQYANIK